MSVIPSRIAAAIACVILFAASSPAPAAQPAQVDASVQNRKLGRGVNIIGYDPIPNPNAGELRTNSMRIPCVPERISAMTRLPSSVRFILVRSLAARLP